MTIVHTRYITAQTTVHRPPHTRPTDPPHTTRVPGRRATDVGRRVHYHTPPPQSPPRPTVHPPPPATLRDPCTALRGAPTPDSDTASPNGNANRGAGAAAGQPCKMHGAGQATGRAGCAHLPHGPCGNCRAIQNSSIHAMCDGPCATRRTDADAGRNLTDTSDRTKSTNNARMGACSRTHPTRLAGAPSAGKQPPDPTLLRTAIQTPHDTDCTLSGT